MDSKFTFPCHVSSQVNFWPWEIMLCSLNCISFMQEYLLFFCNPPIYHVSISSSTIMLDENLVPKLSESSLFGATRSHRASLELPKKESSDQSSSSIIFQLGLVILELITGQSSETGLADLIHWVRESHVPRSTNRMIDPDLGNDYNSTELKGLLAVARLCIDSVDEPSRNTSQILRYLKTQIAPTRASVRSCWFLNISVISTFFPLILSFLFSFQDYNALFHRLRVYNHN